ncbi:MAG: CDP-diacylglycerol--glycerol-3-phosphate 3-phosphatidyltransferase [bacterium]
MSQKFLNLPNWITIGRLLAAPVLLVVMLFIDDANLDVTLNRKFSFVAALVFTLAMCSDMVDGYLARKKGLQSTFGKFIDPLADKMLFIVAMIMMVGLGRMPAWIVAIFFIREVTITALRGIAVDEGIVIAASHWGKYKSAFVSIATVGLLLHYPFFDIQWRLIAWVLIVPSLVFSVGSGLQYSVGFFREVSRQENAA